MSSTPEVRSVGSQVHITVNKPGSGQVDKSFVKRSPDPQGVLVEGMKKGLCCTNIPAAPQPLLCTVRGKAISCTLWDMMNIAEKNKLGVLIIFQINFSLTWVKHQRLGSCTKWPLGAKFYCQIWMQSSISVAALVPLWLPINNCWLLTESSIILKLVLHVSSPGRYYRCIHNVWIHPFL